MLFLTTPTQKSLNQLSAFLNLYQHAKNQFIPFVHFWDPVNFRVPWTNWPHDVLTMPTHNIFDQFLIFVNLYQHFACWSVYFSSSFFRYSQFQSSMTRLVKSIFGYANPKNFRSSYNLRKSVSVRKNSADFICSLLRYSQF